MNLYQTYPTEQMLPDISLHALTACYVSSLKCLIMFSGHLIVFLEICYPMNSLYE